MARKKKAEIPIREFGSPIETMMRNAICHQAANVEKHERFLIDYSTSPDTARAVITDGRFAGIDDDEEIRVNPKMLRWGNPEHISVSLYGRVYISSYKLDFLLLCGFTNAAIGIECDGHEWHERTKEQASSDRARDRAILRLGVPTIRFTGSDIHRDADGCALEVMQTLEAVARASYSNGEMDGFSRGYERGKAARQEQYSKLWTATSGIALPEAL